MEDVKGAVRRGELNLKLYELLRSNLPKPSLDAELRNLREKYGANDLDWMLRVIKADIAASKGVKT